MPAFGNDHKLAPVLLAPLFANAQSLVWINICGPMLLYMGEIDTGFIMYDILESLYVSLLQYEIRMEVLPGEKSEEVRIGNSIDLSTSCALNLNIL